MKKFRYVGPLDAVDVPALGLVDVTRQSLVEVEDPAVSETMEKQPDVWEHVPDPKRSRAAKKAAETRGDKTEEA